MKKISLYSVVCIIFIITEAWAANPLLGVWSSECASNDAGNYNIETFEFQKNTAIYSIKTYSDVNCQHKLSTLSTYREYKLGDKLSGSTDTQKLDYVFKTVTMTYNDPAATQTANKTKNYGFSNWMLNQPKNVANLKISPSSSSEHAAGEKFYTIVKIENDKLYMGDYDSGKGDSDSTRLSSIYHIPFIKETH